MGQFNVTGDLAQVGKFTVIEGSRQQRRWKKSLLASSIAGLLVCVTSPTAPPYAVADSWPADPADPAAPPTVAMDGLPTAHFEGSWLYMLYPPHPLSPSVLEPCRD